MHYFDWLWHFKALKIILMLLDYSNSLSFSFRRQNDSRCPFESGDLAISEVKPDEQPNFDQITESTKNYRLVREKTQDISLISDATFNEGGLLRELPKTQKVWLTTIILSIKTKTKFFRRRNLIHQNFFPSGFYQV